MQKDVKSVSLTLNEANSSGIGEAQLRRVSGITVSQAFGTFKKQPQFPQPAEEVH